MATLSVWKFNDPAAADQVEQTLVDLSRQELITVIDAATVSWPTDRKKPKTRQLNSLVGVGASWGALWGMLFGLLFFVPLLGLAVGAGLGALGGKFSDVGIDDKFIDTVKQKVTPGTSALFLLSENAVVDRIKGAFEGRDVELISTNLSAEQEAQLREAFAEHG